MSKYKIAPRLYAALHLRNKNAAERLGFGRAVHEQIASNYVLFSAPIPSLADQETVLDNLEVKMNAAATGSIQAESELATAIYHFDTMLINVASYVERIANSNPLTAQSTLRAAGFSPGKTKEKSPIPEAVSKLAAIFTNEPSVLLKWKGVKYARAYKVYLTATPDDSNSWKLVDITAKRKMLIEDLESCKRYFFKIVVLGIHGISIESAVVSCVAG